MVISDKKHNTCFAIIIFVLIFPVIHSHIDFCIHTLLKTGSYKTNVLKNICTTYSMYVE